MKFYHRLPTALAPLLVSAFLFGGCESPPNLQVSTVIRLGQTAAPEVPVIFERYAATVTLEVVDTDIRAEAPLRPGEVTLALTLPANEAVTLRLTLSRLTSGDEMFVMATSERTIIPGESPTVTFVFEEGDITDSDNDGMDGISELIQGRDPRRPDRCEGGCPAGSVCCIDRCENPLDFAYSMTTCGECSWFCSTNRETCKEGRCVEQTAVGIEPLDTVFVEDGFSVRRLEADGDTFAFSVQDIRDIEVRLPTTVHIYRFVAGAASLEQVLTEDDVPDGTFGADPRLSISGDTLTIDDRSRVMVFTRLGTRWEYAQTVEAPGLVAVDGDTLAVFDRSRQQEDGSYSAEIAIYNLSDGTWIRDPQVLNFPTEISKSTAAIDLKGDILAVTQFSADTFGEMAVFRRKVGTPGWDVIGRVQGSDQVANTSIASVSSSESWFGSDVRIYGTEYGPPRVAVSASGLNLPSGVDGVERLAAGTLWLYQVNSTSLGRAERFDRLEPFTNEFFARAFVPLPGATSEFRQQFAATSAERILTFRQDSRTGRFIQDELLVGSGTGTIAVGSDFIATSFASQRVDSLVSDRGVRVFALP